MESQILGPAVSIEELHARLVGEWLICGSRSIFDSTDEIGLELAANGQWFKLYADGSGGVMRRRGSDRQGRFEVIDLGDSVQVNLVLASGTMLTTHPQFSANPRKVRLYDGGVDDKVEYIWNGSEGRCASGAALPAPGKYTPPPSCAQRPKPEPQPASVEAVRAAIAGKWALCSTVSTFGTSDDTGLEITPAGEFFKLYVNQVGEWVRNRGFDNEGTYTLADAGGYIALNLEIAGSGTVITSPQLGSSPRALRLDNHGKLVGNYVAIGPANDAKGKPSDAR